MQCEQMNNMLEQKLQEYKYTHILTGSLSGFTIQDVRNTNEQ